MTLLQQAEDLKQSLWCYVEDEDTETQRKIKDTMNCLLDLIDELGVEING